MALCSVRLVTFIAAAVLPFAPSFGQSKGGGTTVPGGTGTGGGGGTGTGNAPTRPSIPTTPQPNTTPTQPNNIPQPILLTGRVMLEDGTPPPESVRIERVCNGSSHGEGFTDSQGYFSIELGRNSAMMQDASESSTFSSGMGGMSGMSGMGQSTSMGGPMGNMFRFQNCEIRGRLAGFRSQSVNLATRGPMDNPDIGVLLLHREGPSESGTTVSARSLAAPKDAKKAFEKGLDFVKKGKVEDAEKSFDKAVAVYPEYSTALCELGRLQAKRGQTDAAKESFNRALQADPKYVDPYLQLSLLALRDQKWEELADLTDKAGKLDSFDYPQVFLFNAVANYNLQKPELAEQSIRRAEKLDTRHQFPQIMHLGGVIMAQKRDYAGAAERFRAYLKVAPNATDAARVRTQLVELEKVTAQSNAAGKDKPNSQ